MSRHRMRQRLLIVLIAASVSLQVLMPSTSTNCMTTEVIKWESSIPQVPSSDVRYVSVCSDRIRSGHRTGNHLFILAAMLYVAARTNRRVLMPSTGWILDDVFDMNIHRINTTNSNNNNPANTSAFSHRTRITYPPGFIGSDPDFEKPDVLANFTEPILALCGLYQTSRYADALGSELRRVLRIKINARREADRFFDQNQPTKWKPGIYTKVGVHVRRGDFLDAYWEAFGVTVATESYFNRSMKYFMSRYKNIHFIVASDDIEWTKNAVVKAFNVDKRSVATSYTDQQIGDQLVISNTSIVTFSVGHSTAADLAILTACDAMIISTGSFSWWAGWLANKTTVYYAIWPRPGTDLYTHLRKKKYFPSRWIPMI